MRKSNKRKKKAINWKIFSRKLMVSFLIIAIAGLAGRKIYRSPYAGKR
jgi:magnesium-transporting ATPase (P-type)